MIRTMNPVRRQQGPFAQAYPSIAKWVHGYGWIEMGEDLPGHAFIQALDAALARWMREQLSR
jgi:hypothetical protein